MSWARRTLSLGGGWAIHWGAYPGYWWLGKLSALWRGETVLTGWCWGPFELQHWKYGVGRLQACPQNRPCTSPRRHHCRAGTTGARFRSWHHDGYHYPYGQRCREGRVKLNVMKTLSLLLGALVLCFGLSGDVAHAQSGGRTTLVLSDGDGDTTVLGIMRYESVCDVVASRLNYYASLPPRDADRFYCRMTY